MLPQKSLTQSDAEPFSAVVKAIWTLYETLPASQREVLRRKIGERNAPSDLKRAGDFTGVVLKMIPRNGPWLVEDIKKKILDDKADAKPKDVYNAIAYLARKGCVRRLSYGRYITTEGHVFETAEDLPGIAPAPGEGDSDD